ncbi:MAG: hypothetical protein V2A54_00010 [Bacteroidota bacterium]
MKKLLLIVLVAFTAQAFVNKAQAQTDRKVMVVKSVDVEKTRGANPNIKTAVKAPNSDNGVKPSNVKKGNAEGTTDCEIAFDNYTNFFVDVYVDGSYKGTIGDWGTLYINASSGYKSVYCISSGGTKEWKVDGSCEGNFLWKLQ